MPEDVTTMDGDTTTTTEPVSSIGAEGNFQGGWKEEYLDEDIRGETFFDSDYVKSVPALLKTALHQERTIGKYKGSSVIIPTDSSSEEDIKAYRETIGVPKEYVYTRPDDIDEDVIGSEFMTKTMERLNKANVSQKQFDEVMGIFADRIRELEAEGIAALNKGTEDANTRLMTEWGSQFDSRGDLSKRFISKMVDKWSAEKYQELFGTENDSGVREGGINSPEFAAIRPLLLDLFATVEETYAIPTSAALSDTTMGTGQSIQDQIDKIMADPEYLKSTGLTPKRHNELVEQVQKLMALKRKKA